MPKRLPLVKTKRYALAYAEAGFPVFPLKRGTKIPATKRGFYNASCDGHEVFRMWRNPYLNIGLRTGKISQQIGLLVLDFDGEAGQEALKKIQRKHGKLPVTHHVASPNGNHFYFLYDASVWRIPSSVGRIAEGMDVRAEGGYIVTPPSIHPTGKHYMWVIGSLTTDNLPPYAPDWLLKLLTAPKNTKKIPPTKLLQQPILNHHRDVTLTAIAGSLFGYGLPSNLIILLMRCINKALCVPPLEDEQVQKIIQSIARRETSKRRELP